ncbi:hypothetical protein E2562_000445 [Oryza meyeriana var. granulata]|uniref:Vesicle-fusing ATPase n=1 Tax=Oryza meyeriana var. granulata TaxID=110450 RepID=A0A6G1CC44_9ORYZ|nr:hypothetical protein E2562_000445 [Oryza meyeriana var. granulata]
MSGASMLPLTGAAYQPYISELLLFSIERPKQGTGVLLWVYTERVRRQMFEVVVDNNGAFFTTSKALSFAQLDGFQRHIEAVIVNGPEVLSKFVGETEKNVRDLFADAENDQSTHGDQSDPHVIIFDEIDAICKVEFSPSD